MNHLKIYEPSSPVSDFKNRTTSPGNPELPQSSTQKLALPQCGTMAAGLPQSRTTTKWYITPGGCILLEFILSSITGHKKR